MRFAFGAVVNKTFALNYMLEVFVVDTMIDNHKLILAADSFGCQLCTYK